MDESERWEGDRWAHIDREPDVEQLIRVIDIFEKVNGFQEARLAMFRDGGLAPGQRVLDVGCGTGNALWAIAQMVGRDGLIVGIDSSAVFIREARRRAAQLGMAGLDLRIGRAQSLPFREGSFGFTFCEKLLCHAGPAQVIISEMARVTRSGGKVAALEWDMDSLCISTDYLAVTRRLIENAGRLRYNSIAGRQLRGQFLAEGLKNVRMVARAAHTTELGTEGGCYILFENMAERGVAAGAITEAERGRWLQNLKELDGREAFSLVIVIHYVVGTRA